MFAYVGSFDLSSSTASLSAYRMDGRTGELAHLQDLEVCNPSFLALDPRGARLYAATRSGRDGPPCDAVLAFSIDRQTGLLSQTCEVPVPPQPCYVAIDRDRRSILFAASFSNAFGSIPLSPDGILGKPIIRHISGPSLTEQGISLFAGARWPRAPFPHSIIAAPNNRFALIADVGSNAVYTCRLTDGLIEGDVSRGATGSALTAAWMRERNPMWVEPEGAGPRHLDFHPNGRWLYAVNESSSSITAFQYERHSGGLEVMQDLPGLPANFEGMSFGGDIRVHPNGRFLYATHRGHDSVGCYEIDETGGVRPMNYVPTAGAHPRNIAVSPGFELMLVSNHGSGTIAAMRIDSETGALTPTGVINAARSPSCTVIFDPGR